ncbi:hypothetical protein KMZ30_07240 [Phycicoccus sp. KQZ13P-1]|uniref:hypothetical protein n=1 Tax=Phycicoccus mangrovi TaxID=2840470 RepID=UPI001C006839|nr:hypothetical protein [Phycicoccus mangrovi]MBT9255365.1 hypothetical protein [Phycicoccus mangrovi]
MTERSVTFRAGALSVTGSLVVTERRMLLGTTELAYDALAAAVGPMTVRRSYDGPMPTNIAASKAQADLTAGRVPWISFTTASASAMRPFFASCVGKGRVMVTVAHEVDLGTKGLTASQFRALFADLAAARDLEGATNVQLVVILTASPFRSGTYVPFIPDPAHFDVVAADAYRFWRPPGSPPDPKTGNLSQSRPMSWIVGELPAYAASIGKPWALGEFGAHPFPGDPSNRPTWITETVTWCRANGCTALVYFHSGNGESGPWWLDRYHFPEATGTTAAMLAAGGDQASLAAWRAQLT